MAERVIDPLNDSRRDRCKHGVSFCTECEQCVWEQSVADDQAADDDWTGDDDGREEVGL